MSKANKPCEERYIGGAHFYRGEAESAASTIRKDGLGARIFERGVRAGGARRNLFIVVTIRRHVAHAYEPKPYYPGYEECRACGATRKVGP